MKKYKRDYEHFQEGSEKLNKELDLIAIVDAMRKVHILSDLLMDRHQNFLAENLPINHIDPKEEMDLKYPKGKEAIEDERIEEKIEDMWESPGFDHEHTRVKELLFRICGKGKSWKISKKYALSTFICGKYIFS